MPILSPKVRARTGLLTVIISAGTRHHEGEWEVSWIGKAARSRRGWRIQDLPTAALD
jgi:hypothetical protein